MNSKRIENSKKLLEGYGPEQYAELCNRRTGKTTQLVWYTLMHAYENKGCWVDVVDHHPMGHKHLLNRICETLTTLGLDFHAETKGRKYPRILIPYFGPLSPDEMRELGLL